MNKKKLFIILVLMLPMFIILYLCWSDCWTTMKINWEISLPYMSFYREMYHKDSGPSFNGDGTRYHVFSYKNEKYIEKKFNWEIEEKATEYNSSYSEFIETKLVEIEVPEKERPEYSNCKYWYNKNVDDVRDEIVICWDEEKSKLFVIEYFA